MMKYLGLAIAIIGALTSYSAKFIMTTLKMEITDKSIVKIKSIGLFVAIAGALLVFFAPNI